MDLRSAQCVHIPISKLLIQLSLCYCAHDLVTCGVIISMNASTAPRPVQSNWQTRSLIIMVFLIFQSVQDRNKKEVTSHLEFQGYSKAPKFKKAHQLVQRCSLLETSETLLGTKFFLKLPHPLLKVMACPVLL